ncbi:MAG: type II toxin-antitoxin system VapC family toxin [Opitutaceae bacterium]|nr:type II toxin-antitoxin system VapC family toxin [Opitutaceae bacterium]
MAYVCCDTSFLFSLYGRDANSARALAAVTRLRQALTLSALNDFEFRNAVRFAVFRQILAPADLASILAAYESDVAGGRLIVEQVNLAQVVTEASRLSATHTVKGGHRSFDLLHVAVATHLGAGVFLSFDTNQAALAKRVGLKVAP